MYSNLQMVEIMPRDGRKSFYGKCKAIHANNGVFCLSYDTIVCYIDECGKFHRTWGGYSATTMRHVNAFCEEFNVREEGTRYFAGGKKWWDSLEVDDRPYIKRAA